MRPGFLWYSVPVKKSFWDNLQKPFFALAPLANVTDAAFRYIIAKYSKYGGRDIARGSKESLPAEALRAGGPDVLFTEFVSADGLLSKGRDILLKDLLYSESERPIVAQLFTAHPDKMEEAGKLIAKLGFDGLDINMGCPDRAVEKQGAGAALIKNPKRARELIRAAKESGLPVSLKTRLGYNKDELETWLPELLAETPTAITIHARTRKEMSKVPARWERVKRAVEIRNALKSETLILGNGDVTDMKDARQKAEESGADGVMLGRAIFGNPWLFANSSRLNLESGTRFNLSINEKLAVMVEHTKLFEELLGEIKNFAIMKKHYKAYANGFDGAKELRIKLMEAENAAEVENIVNNFLME
ncbi:MAG: tRNA-dihydrouridine synthase [bacterium]|nr:tRNA-dihydrouridine synthase [bacterium]